MTAALISRDDQGMTFQFREDDYHQAGGECRHGIAQGFTNRSGIQLSPQ